MVVPMAVLRQTCVGVFCEAETLGPSSLLIVYEAEVEDPASAAEDIYDLFFGKSCRRGRKYCINATEQLNCKSNVDEPYGMFPTKTTLDGGFDMTGSEDELICG